MILVTTITIGTSSQPAPPQADTSTAKDPASTATAAYITNHNAKRKINEACRERCGRQRINKEAEKEREIKKTRYIQDNTTVNSFQSAENIQKMSNININSAPGIIVHSSSRASCAGRKQGVDCSHHVNRRHCVRVFTGYHTSSVIDNTKLPLHAWTHAYLPQTWLMRANRYEERWCIDWQPVQQRRW